jgi:hypothetical protein
MQTHATESAIQQAEWTLSADQMIFMLQHHNGIEAAYEADDLEALRELAASDEYKAIFGDMSFDEAYDRYECTLESERGEP